MDSQQRRRISEKLAQLADDPAREAEWPAESVAIALDAGWRGWCIPDEYGGKLQPPTGLLESYEMLGRGDLSTALIVTQHDAAVDLIGKGENDQLKQRLLPKFASGELQTTVGISQLTTSRQGGPPAMAITRDGDGFRLNGVMPWVTAPHECSHIVTGGVLDDGSQLLASLPCDRTGVRIEQPLQMLGLNASWTAAVHCDSVKITGDDIIRGPAAKALSRRSTVKPLVVSAVGIGLCGALIDLIDNRTTSSESAFRDLAEELMTLHQNLAKRILDAAQRIESVESLLTTGIRASVNDLAGRLALAGMTLAKGSGYVRGHRAERLMREALFMQVWSAPLDVRRGALEKILGR